MARSEYHPVTDGEWITPVMKDHKLMCCDCLLVHTVDFRKRDGGGIDIRFRRDNRATAAARRAKKKSRK